MNRTLTDLVLQRVDQLGQIAFTAHENCMKWRRKETDINLVEESVKLKQALEEQHDWVCALREYLQKKADK